MGQFIRFWSFWKHESWLAATLSKQQGGSARKIYSITDKGRDRFQEKMLEHPHESWVNSRSRFLIKFFFFSDIEPAKRIKLIEHPLMVCRLRLENQQREPTPADPYQAVAWQRSLEVIEGEIHWLSQQLATEKEPQRHRGHWVREWGEVAGCRRLDAFGKLPGTRRCFILHDSCHWIRAIVAGSHFLAPG